MAEPENDGGDREHEDWLRRMHEALAAIPDHRRQREIQEAWCIMRELSITELEALRDSLSAWHLATNYAEVSGGAAALISNIVSIGAQIASMFGWEPPEITQRFLDNARLGGILGRLFRAGAKGTEKAVQWRKAHKISSVLKEDQDKSIVLLEILQPKEQFAKVAAEMASFDMFVKVVEFFKRPRNWNIEEGPELPPRVRDMLQSLRFSKTMEPKLERFLRAIYQTLPSRNSFQTLMNNCRNISFASGKQAYDDLRYLKHKVLETSSITIATTEKSNELTKRERMLNAAWLAMDVLELCSLYKTMSEKCRDMNVESELVRKLQECIDLMQDELDSVKALTVDDISED